jgi:thymidylate kinase
MAPDQGRLIVIEDIGGDGAIRDLIVDSFRDRLLPDRGYMAYDLDLYNRKAKEPFFLHGDNTFFYSRDALIVSEPTISGIGLTIRGEIKREEGYSALAVAIAHALDRQVLYKRTVLPFLRTKAKRLVLQRGGLITSLAQQTLLSEDEGRPLTVKDLLELPEFPGNRLELSRRPDLIILLAPPLETRLSGRYRSPEVIEAFESKGSHIVFVDTDRLESAIVADCLQAFNELLAA